MNEQESASDVVVSDREKADVVKRPGGLAGMLATRPAVLGKTAGGAALIGVGAYAALGIIDAAAHVIGYAVCAVVFCYGVKTYRRHRRHDDP